MRSTTGLGKVDSLLNFVDPDPDRTSPDKHRVSKHYGMSGRHHSGLMLAARITLAHFSVSSTMSLPNSAGVIGIGRPPNSASRALILASAMAALISLFNLSMISAGVLVGTPMPNQPVAS